MRVAGSWYRQCAFAKILSGSRPCDAGSQTNPVEFVKHKEKGHRKSALVGQPASAAEGGEAGGGVSNTAAAADDDGSDDQQENHYTYV